MSVVTVQVGQAGNQVGHQFYETLFRDREHKHAIEGLVPGLGLPPHHQHPHGGHSALAAACDDGSAAAAIDRSMGLDRHFDTDSAGRCMTRAVMIDMESKVTKDTASASFFGRCRCWGPPELPRSGGMKLRPSYAIRDAS